MIILVCKVLTSLASNSVAHKTLRNAVHMCVCVRVRLGSYHQDGRDLRRRNFCLGVARSYIRMPLLRMSYRMLCEWNMK